MNRHVVLRRRALAIAGAIGVAALLWLLLGGQGGDDEESAASGTRAPTSSPQTEELLVGLSTEEKVDQLILAGLEPGSRRSPGVGGIFVGADAWPGEDDGKALLKGLRKGEEIPPLIATRQEGGVYRELEDLPAPEREIEIGDRGETDAARKWAEEIGEALREQGFDLNLAPVADIATLDSPLADRAFSDDPVVTTALTGAAIAGCRMAGIACAPSHFPGAGGASQDTAAGPATVSVDVATLLARDVRPFQIAFQQGAPAVVVSNAFYAGYDPVTPASLSPEILDGLLRERLGFEGVAITDDLAEGAIRAVSDVPDAAVAAVAAGADMVQISRPKDVVGIRRALTEAVAAEELPITRLDEAAGRVLELKRSLGLLRR